jgi:hypothetical protein
MLIRLLGRNRVSKKRATETELYESICGISIKRAEKLLVFH